MPDFFTFVSMLKCKEKKTVFRVKIFMISLIFYGLFLNQVSAQNPKKSFLSSFFQEIELLSDTSVFLFSKDLILHKGERQLPFYYSNEQQSIEVRFYLKVPNENPQANFSVLPNKGYEITDSLRLINDAYYSINLRFNELSSQEFLKLSISMNNGGKPIVSELRLLAFTAIKATFYPGADDLYVGEEKVFEIVSNSPKNIVLDGFWKEQSGMEYRLFENDGKAFIALLPLTSGAKKMNLTFSLRKPVFDGKTVNYSLLMQEFNFNVKGSRLSFLRLDAKEIVRKPNNKEGIELQLENNRGLQVGKTYRIEDREDPGGPLIAELYTIRLMSNDKVLCNFRPYAYHNSSDGYLFIKNGDRAQFITNINILPEAKVSRIQLLREGEKWTNNLSVRPGETVEIMLDGEGLSRANFYFDELLDVSEDTVIRSDNRMHYMLKVPINIRKQNIDIYNADKKTGFSLKVQEYERPRPLDFINIDYGEKEIMVSRINQPILYPHTVRDVFIDFDPSRIDKGNVLYGKQFIEIEVKLLGPKDELLAIHKIENVVVCPGENSPRYAFYQGPACNMQNISLNSILSKKTHSLESWSRIELIFRHKKDKYEGGGFEQKVEIYVQKKITFDIEVSFPAGLVIKKVGVDGFPGLGGISLAMLAQFSFYDNEKIRKPKPYKIGAGFLAQNAFNFNPEVVDRDLGIVILGSVYPTRQDAKFSFPLYAGFGYYLNESRFFYLIGPGIRVNF